MTSMLSRGGFWRRPVLAVTAGHLSTEVPLRSLPKRAVLAAGHGAALLDVGIVQDTVAADRRDFSLGRFHATAAGGPASAVLVWSRQPSPVRIELSGLVTRDGHDCGVLVDVRLQMRVSATPGLQAPDLPATTQDASQRITLVLQEVLQAHATNNDGQVVFSQWPNDPCIRELVIAAAEGALAPTGATVTVEAVTVRNEFFAALRRRQLGLAQGTNDLATLEDASRLRAEVRRLARRDQLLEWQQEADVNAAAALIAQEDALRALALRGELERAHLERFADRVSAVRRQAAMISDLMGALDQIPSASLQSLGQFSTALQTQFGVSAGRAGLTAHEVEQARALMAESVRVARSPEELLAALEAGPWRVAGLGDPFARIQGTHIATVGRRWRVFDGEILWSLTVTRIQWRRCGFLWLRRRPSHAELHASGRPGGRELRWHVGAKDVPLDLGRGDVHCRLDVDGTGGPALRFTSSHKSQAGES